MRRSTAVTAAAAVLLIAASLAAAYAAISAYGERSEELETRRMFRDWMAKFNKTYGTIAEEEHRYAVYKENQIRGIRCTTSFDAAGLLNVFGDLTDLEMSSIYPGFVHADHPDPPYPVRPIYWSEKGTGGQGQAVSR